MIGPEHYKAAEQIIATAKGRDLPIGAAADIAAVAQVHATLALAAAHALSAFDMPAYDSDAWREIAATSKPPEVPQ